MIKTPALRIALLSASLVVPVAALNAAEPEEQIKYRQNVMKSIGGHTSAIFAITGDKAGDESHLEAHIRSLAATSTVVKDIFPPESELGETRAKAEIWTDAEGFADAVKAVEDAAAGVLAAYENGGDLGGALRDLGGSCKGCHDEYRSD